MKVVHLISGLRGGGAEHLVLELCKESKRRGDIDMQVVLLANITDILQKFTDHNITVITPASLRIASTSRAITAWKMIRYLAASKPPVIHAHMYYAAIAACLVKLFSKTRVIFTLHNTFQPSRFKRLLLFITRPLRDTDVIFPGSPPAWYQKSNATAIANGIDTSVPEEAVQKFPVFTCLFAGRLDNQKNPLALIPVIKSLTQQHNIRFIFAGDGPLKSKLEQAVIKHKLQHQVELTGFTNNVRELMVASHCLLLPSKWEGMPLVVLEAAVAKLPVVATPTGNLPAFLNTHNSWVGSVDQFPTFIASILTDPASAFTKANKLHEDVIKTFTISRCYNAHLLHYTR